LKAIFLFLILIGLLILISVLSYFLLNKILFPFLTTISDRISTFFLNKIINKHRTLFIAEILFIFASVLFLGSLFFFVISNNLWEEKNQYLFFSIMLFYSIFVVVESSFVSRIKKELGEGNYSSKLENFMSYLSSDNYIFSRLKLLFGRTFFSFMIHFLAVYILLVVSTAVNTLPTQTYYFILVTFPIALVSWIYFTSKDKTEQGLRRILVYLFILVLAFVRSYSDFQALLGIVIFNEVDEYIVILLLTLFIALDRLFKSVRDDYEDYMKKKNSG
jgi:hypothetical protein